MYVRASERVRTCDSLFKSVHVCIYAPLYVCVPTCACACVCVYARICLHMWVEINIKELNVTTRSKLGTNVHPRSGSTVHRV